MDTLRDDLVPDTDSSMDRTATAREKFLLEEGLEMLAYFRAIGDPELRRIVMRLVASIAESQTREQ